MPKHPRSHKQALKMIPPSEHETHCIVIKCNVEGCDQCDKVTEIKDDDGNVIDAEGNYVDPNAEDKENPDNKLKCHLTEVGEKLKTHYEKVHNLEPREIWGNYAQLAQIGGASLVSSLVCSNSECLKHQFFTLPVLVLWILVPLYIWRVKPAYIVGMLMSVLGIIMTFAHPSLVNVPAWYEFTRPAWHAMFVLLIGFAAVNIPLSYKAYMNTGYVCPSCVKPCGTKKRLIRHVQEEHPEKALEWMRFSRIKPE